MIPQKEKLTLRIPKLKLGYPIISGWNKYLTSGFSKMISIDFKAKESSYREITVFMPRPLILKFLKVEMFLKLRKI